MGEVLSLAAAREALVRDHLGIWHEQRRGFENAAFHWEWTELAQRLSRLALVAPRDHSKTETLTISQSCWRMRYRPGLQALGLTADRDLAKELVDRVVAAMAESEPEMFPLLNRNAYYVRFSNYASFSARSRYQKVRGRHPDFIIGDDVLEEQTCLTHYQRKKTERWWHGTIEGMAHSGTWRRAGRLRVWMPPTVIHLVGTPFHAADLLMAMRGNPVWHFYRYAAEFEPDDLHPGTLAVEVA